MKPKSKRIGAHKKSAHKKAAHKKVKRPRPAKSPQIKQTSDSGPNLDFKFFPIRSWKTEEMKRSNVSKKLRVYV